MGAQVISFGFLTHRYLAAMSSQLPETVENQIESCQPLDKAAPHKEGEPREAHRHLSSGSTSHIYVHFAGAVTSAEGKKEYSFDLIVKGTPVARYSGSYSHLRKRCLPVFGDFPPKHIFEDFNTNDANVARRGEELRRFFELHLNAPSDGQLDTMGLRPPRKSTKKAKRPSSTPVEGAISTSLQLSSRAPPSSPIARKAKTATSVASSEANVWIKRVKMILGFTGSRNKEVE